MPPLPLLFSRVFVFVFLSLSCLFRLFLDCEFINYCYELCFLDLMIGKVKKNQKVSKATPLLYGYLPLSFLCSFSPTFLPLTFFSSSALAVFAAFF